MRPFSFSVTDQLSVLWRAKLHRALFFHKKDWTLVEIISSKLRWDQLNFRWSSHLWQRSIIARIFCFWSSWLTDNRRHQLLINLGTSGVYRTLVRIESIINALALILIFRSGSGHETRSLMRSFWTRFLPLARPPSLGEGEASDRSGNTSALENSQAPGNCPPNPMEIGMWQLFQVIAL